QSFGIAIGLEGMNRGAFVQAPGWSFRLMTMLTLTAGTAFLMWVGEQITERGIGNGISLIIFAGIVARLPAAVVEPYRLFDVGQLIGFWLVMVIVGMVGVMAAIGLVVTGWSTVSVQVAACGWTRRWVARE